MRIATTAVRIKATLAHVAPDVVRSIVVPLTIRLDRLHVTLQAAFGWSNTHLYAFHAQGLSWGEPDPDFPDTMADARKTRLYDIVRDTGAKTIRYVYDFGDDWEHVIKLEKWFEDTVVEGMPVLLHAKGRCPPEDVGGPSGYEAFLATLRDPTHPDHAENRAWAGENFDANSNALTYAENAKLERAVEDLAQQWRPKPRKAKP